MKRSTPLSRLLLVAAAAAAFALAPAHASASLFGGAGLVYTDFDDGDNDSRFGSRIYGGYDFFRIPMAFRLCLEGGYTRTGSFGDNGSNRYDNWDAGLQATVTTVPLVNFHGRVGYEWGDSDGAMYALGGSVSVLPLTRVRAEYQDRNDFDAGMLSIEVRLP